MLDANNIREANFPLYLVMSFFGLAPYGHDCTSSRRFFGSRIFSLLLITGHAAFGVVWCHSLLAFLKWLPYSEVLPSVIFFGFNHLCGVWTVSNRMFGHRHKEYHAWTVLQSLDTFLLADSHRIYKRRRLLLICYVSFLLIWDIVEGVLFSSFSGSGLNLFSYFVFTGNSLAIMSFVNWVAFLFLRFKRVNELLIDTCGYCVKNNIDLVPVADGRECFHQDAMMKSWALNKFAVKAKAIHISSDHIRTLDDLQQHHLKLVKISRHINSVYGSLNALVLGEAIITSISAFILMIIEMNRKQRTQQNLMIFIGLVSSLTRSIIKTFVMCYFCEETSNEANGTSAIIHDLLVRLPVVGKTTESLKKFGEQVRDTKLQFSAYGLVPINANALTVVYSTVVTYSIIILQFYITEGAGQNTSNATLLQFV